MKYAALPSLVIAGSLLALVSSPADARRGEVFFGEDKGKQATSAADRMEGLLRQQVDLIADIQESQLDLLQKLTIMQGQLAQQQEATNKLIDRLITMQESDELSSAETLGDLSPAAGVATTAPTRTSNRPRTIPNTKVIDSDDGVTYRVEQ